MREIENYLKSPTYYKEMIGKCVRIGGMNIKDMVVKLLSNYMTKNLMYKYSVMSQRGKLPFKDTKLFFLIRDTCLEKNTWKIVMQKWLI